VCGLIGANSNGREFTVFHSRSKEVRSMMKLFRSLTAFGRINRGGLTPFGVVWNLPGKIREGELRAHLLSICPTFNCSLEGGDIPLCDFRDLFLYIKSIHLFASAAP
jgi:hypothetical protein